MGSFFKFLKETWVKSVSAFPFLEFATEPNELKTYDPEEIKFSLAYSQARWLIFLDNLLGQRGGIIWNGNWDQKKVPLDLGKFKTPSQNPQDSNVKSDREEYPVVVIDREGEIILLKGENILGEKLRAGKRKMKSRVAFCHAEWAERVGAGH